MEKLRTEITMSLQLTECGGIITKPSELKPLMHGEEYFGLMNCTWIIKAPQGKSVLVRFEKFILEYSVRWVSESVSSAFRFITFITNRYRQFVVATSTMSLFTRAIWLNRINGSAWFAETWLNICRHSNPRPIPWSSTLTRTTRGTSKVSLPRCCPLPWI